MFNEQDTWKEPAIASFITYYDECLHQRRLNVTYASELPFKSQIQKVQCRLSECIVLNKVSFSLAIREKCLLPLQLALESKNVKLAQHALAGMQVCGNEVLPQLDVFDGGGWCPADILVAKAGVGNLFQLEGHVLSLAIIWWPHTSREWATDGLNCCYNSTVQKLDVSTH